MSIGSLGIKTHAVGLAPSIEAIARSVNRRGIVVRVRASDFTQPLGKMSASASEFTKSLEASNARVIAFGASAVIIGSVTTSFAQLVVQAVKVEKILADINAVLATSNENLAKFGDGLFNVARNTSQALEVAAEAALEFSRQGLSMEETLKRTNDALILTRLTGLAAADSVKGLTAAVNGFADAGLNTTEIINKLAAVDVKFAVSADDLINALARAGAVAQDAGVSFDQLIGAVTSAQQITARGGAVIGNSFKTIFTRLQRSSTLDRLQELGIAVKDLQGNTLPALTVLRELSRSYDTLGAATKAAVAEQVGGVFQINILKAALKDLGRENSLYSQATITSSEATNEAYQKNAMLQETLSSIATQTLTTVRELTANLGDLTLAPALKDFLDNFNSVIKTVSDLFGAEKGESIGADFAKGLARAVGSVLTGPGFFGLVLVFGKLFSSALKFAKNSVKDLLQIKTIKDQELGIQESIVNAMLRNVELSEQLVKLDGNQVKQEELVLAVLRQQTKEIEQQRQIAQNIAPALRRAGVQPNLIVTGNKSQKTQNSASGLIPNYSKQPTPIEEMKEKAGAKEGGYIAGKVSTMSIPKMGRVIYNDNETVKRFKGMDQPAIMPPKSSKAGKQYGKEFAGKHGFDPYASYGLIPNFALEATKVPGTNILNLPKAKMITETTQSNFKGEVTKGWRTLEAPLDNIVKSAMSYRDEFEALKKLGVNILRRKMYFSSQKSNIKQNEMRAISRDQKKLSKSKGFASKNQHKITGNRFEGSLFNSSLQQKGYYPSWTGAYTAKGRQKGEGDENFKVDFFAPGRKPIESKYGKYTAPNLIAKSIRLYSDQYIEKFLSKHGSSGLAENMGNKKLQDSSQMLTSLGYEDVGPKEVLRAGLSGGLIPNFAQKIKRDVDRKKGSYGVSSDYMGLSGFANYLDQMSKAHPEIVSPKVAKTFFDRLQSSHNKDKNSAKKNNPIGFGPKGSKHYSAMAGVSSSKRTVSTNNLSIKDINKHIQHYNKHGIFAVDKVDSYDSLLSEGYIPNFANRIYDRDRIQPGMATKILEQILGSSPKKQKHLLLGPAGSGKTTMAAQKYGSFIKDLKDAQTAESYTILSGAGMTKKGGLSDRLQKIINAVNQSEGGMVSYLRVSDKTIDERRDKRLSQPAKGDLRSLNQLKGTKKAAKNQPDFIKAVKSLSTNFREIKAFDGYIPNFESQNWQNEKSSGTIDNQLKEIKDRAEVLEDKKGSKNHSHYNRGFIPNFFRSFVKTKKGTINAAHAYHLGSVGTGIVFKPKPGQSPKSETLVGKTAKLAPNKKTIDFDTLAEATVNSSYNPKNSLPYITRRVKGSGVAISFNTKPGNAYEKAIQASYVIKGWTGVGPANLDFTDTKWAKRDMPTANKLKTPIGGGPKNLNKYWRYADAHFGAGHGARPILEKLIRSKLVNKKMIERAMTSGLLDLTASRFSKTSKFAEIVGSGGENLGYTSSKIFKPLQSNQGVNKETFGNFEGAFKEPSGFSGSNSDGAFAIKFPKDHFNHLNKPKNESPIPQEHAIGYIPNFSAWNPLTKNTQNIAKQGGLANNKFGLAKIIQNSRFADLLRRYNHWNNFPEKHKKRLNLWLRSQGYTNRALQGWGLLSKHSKSIASGAGDLAAHHGHIPNFANPLGDAISREKEALRERGSAADIYIDQDNRLKNPKNPAGLLVANTRDEPKSGSQGVNRAISMGMDPKTHGASGGIVPNFVPIKKPAQFGDRFKQTNSSNKETQKTADAMKKTGDASNDLMMRMMGLTTVTYALQGAMGEVTEEASNFQKGMGILNAAIMGLSQAAMVSMMVPKGKFAEGKKQFNEARTKPATPAEGSGAKGKIKAQAGKAGAMLKGVGGMAMGILGPIGMAAAVLIPVIQALTDNFDTFKSATELATRDLEKMQKGLSKLENASSAAASLRDTSAKIYELEQKGSSRSISQQKEYYKLKNDEMKQQNKLNSAINQVVINHSSQNETGQQSEKIQKLLNGSYEQQIAILDQMQVVQQRLINQAGNRKNLAESLESAGAGDFGAELSDYAPELRIGARNTLSGFNTDFSQLNSSDIKALESSINNLKAGLSGGEEGDDIDEYSRRDAEVIVRALTKGQDLSPGDFSNQVDSLINTFVTAAKSADTTGITFDETFQAAGKLFLSEIGKGAKSAFDAARSGEKTRKDGPDLTFNKNLRDQGLEYMKEQSFLLSREVKLMENRLDLQEKMIDLEKKRMGFFDVELPDMFGLLTKDEKIDRETSLDQKSLMDNLKVNESKIDLESGDNINKILSELMQPEDFAQALFNKEDGFRKNHLQLLKDIVAANYNSEDKKEFEKEKEKKLDIAKKEHQSQSAHITEEANDMNMLSALLGQGSFGQMEGMTKINTNKKKGDDDPNSVYGKRQGFSTKKLNTLLDSNEKALKESLKKAGVSEAAIESQLGRIRESIKKQTKGYGKNFRAIFEAASKQTYAADQLKGIEASKKNVENIQSTKFIPKTSQSSDTPQAQRNETEAIQADLKQAKTNLENTSNATEDVSQKEIDEAKRDGANIKSNHEKKIAINKRTEDTINKQAKTAALNSNLQDATKENSFRANTIAQTGTLNPPVARETMAQYSTPPTIDLLPQQTSSVGFNKVDELYSSDSGINPTEVESQAQNIADKFLVNIESLLSESRVKDKDGEDQQALDNQVFSGVLQDLVKDPKVSGEVKIKTIENLLDSSLISDLNAVVSDRLREAKGALMGARDEKQHLDEKAKVDSQILNLDNLKKKISERTNQGADAARLFLDEYTDVQGDLLNSERDRFQSVGKWGDIDTGLAEMSLQNMKILQSTGEVYNAQKKAAESTLTTQLKTNIFEIENQKAINDSKDGTEKGLELTEQGFSLESEKLRTTQIDLNNKLKLPNLSELLFKQATQESDIKTKQLVIENKLLAQKTKLYETTDALAKEVQAELENQRQKDYNAGLRSDGAFKDKSGIIKNKDDPFYGMTGFEADATIRQGTIARSQRDQLAAARSDYELYTGRGNDLRASDARLQMLQIQKQQNIEQGNGSLFSDTIAVKIAETNAEMERFGETLGNITFDTVQQGLKDVVTAMGDSTKSMKDVFLGFAGHIANAIGDALLDRATKQVTSGLMGLLGFDDISQNYNGGLIKGYASGGSTGSKAPAMLTAGEYVVRKKVVDRLGTSSLDKMNKTGNIDDSLSELYSKPNDESFDMSTQGAANIPPVMRFNEGGRLNAAISSITSPIAKFFSGGGFSNPFAPADESSNMMKFARGAGYVGGSSLAQYENREPVETSSPTAPVNPGETMLNTSSALSIDPTGRMMSARYRSTDSYSQQYGDYLLAKYQADVDAQNQKVMNKANEAQGVLGKFTGAMIGHGVQQGITALSALKDVTGGFSDWSTSTQELNVQQHMAQKGINNASDLQSKSSALFNASHGGANIGRENKLSKSQYAASLDMNRYAGETDFSQLNNFELSRMKDRGSQGFSNTHNRDRNFNVQRPMESASEASMQRELDVLGKEVGVLRKQTHPSASGNIRYTSSKNYGVSPRPFTPDNSIIGQDARGTHLQSLKTKQMSRGGKVFGPSGRDQVGPIMLDKGEYVIRASSVNNIEKKYPGFFDKLNSMKMNAGGPVDPNAQIKTEDQASGGGGGVTVNINVSSGGQASAEGGDSSDQAFASKIKDAVTQVISQEKRVGGMLSGK